MVIPQETIHNSVTSMLAALRWIDNRLEYPERRALYHRDDESGRAMFMLDNPYEFEVGDNLRTDIGMAGFFGKKALLDDKHQFHPNVLDRLTKEGYTVNSIVCVGDNVSSWIVVGKHFALEMRNSKFD